MRAGTTNVTADGVKSGPDHIYTFPKGPPIGPDLQPYIFWNKMAFAPENTIPPPIFGPNSVRMSNQTSPPIIGGPHPMEGVSCDNKNLTSHDSWITTTQHLPVLKHCLDKLPDL